jgi:hypothetical protein
VRGGTAWELNPDNAGQGGEPEGGGVKTRVERSQMEVWGGGAKRGVQVRQGGGGAGRKDGGRGAGNGSDTVGCTSELDMDERWTQNA